jgi:hypothetical protein
MKVKQGKTILSVMIGAGKQESGDRRDLLSTGLIYKQTQMPLLLK